MRTSGLWMSLLVMGLYGLASPALAIEAVKGKQYTLTKKHGPWLIMVASFSEPPQERRKQGLTPKEAADELVYELRMKGIPAYAFSNTEKDEYEAVKSVDRFGREEKRWIVGQQGSISVLAGNYPSTDDKVGQATLAWVKKFTPKVLRGVQETAGNVQVLQNGGVIRKTPGRPTPLAGAFLTLNPLLTPEELAVRKKDPLIVQLNSGMEHSLLQNKGKYTLTVATFRGKSIAQTSATSQAELDRKFKVGTTLDDAAEDAWQLTKRLRQLGLEAYTYHDHYQSIVTVGAYNSANDPQIRTLATNLGAKIQGDPGSQKSILTAEAVTLPGRNPGDAAVKTWILDPYPQLIEVPQY